jgi:hypothetical protein
LGDILVRIALESDTASGLALRKALAAFASLHRYGFHAQAIELKIAALRSLAAGSEAPSLCAKEAIRHVATGMLLCSFEVHQSSCTSGHWTGYLSGVKTIIHAVSVKTLLQVDPDVAVLLDWMYYHEVHAHFSLLYWKRGGGPELSSLSADHFRPEVREDIKKETYKRSRLT